MKKRFVCLCLIVLFAMIPFVSQSETVRGFDTPEQCATALFESLTKQDMTAMEDCIAFREMAEQFDFTKYSERIGMISIFTTLMPANSPMNITYNESELKRRWYMRLCNAALTVNNPAFATYLSAGQPIAKQSENYQTVMDMYTGANSQNGFSSLSMVGLIDAANVPQAGEKYASEQNQQNMKTQLAIWGVTNFREVAIQLQWKDPTGSGESRDVLLPLRLIQINGRWLVDPNFPNIGAIMGMSSFDLLVPVTESN